MLWRPCATALQGYPYPGSVSSTRKAKLVQDATNRNCSNRRGLSSTPKAVLTCDTLAGKDLIQPGQKPIVILYSMMSMQMCSSSISSNPRYYSLGDALWTICPYLRSHG
jgi:hypothetical protein